MRKTTIRLLGSFAVLGVAAAMAGLGTFATFTSSTSASHTISSGTVAINLGATGAANLDLRNVLHRRTRDRERRPVHIGRERRDRQNLIHRHQR